MMLRSLCHLSPKSLLYLLVLISVLAVFHMWVLKHMMALSDDMATIFKIERRGSHPHKKFYSKDIKYILSWSKHYLAKPENPFLKYNCKMKNCILTDEVNYMHNVSQFDAIIFFEFDLYHPDRPLVRTPSQVYIFVSIESAYRYPACELYNDNYYNLTFTYRLDSDIVWPYFNVRNLTGHVVAPTLTPTWQISPGPLNETIKAILLKKTKAAAWLVSNCMADSQRDDFLSDLQEELYQYSLHIDVYGNCSRKNCGTDEQCHMLLEKDYHFYMAFENCRSADYISEKVIRGYRSYAVPVVYGGANCTRFLPPGSYLDALEMGPHKLAVKIREAVENPDIFERYFYYTNLYYFDAVFQKQHHTFPAENHPLCDLCQALHNKTMTRQRPAIENFRVWWNGLNGMKWCLSDAYWNETNLVNTDLRHLHMGEIY